MLSTRRARKVRRSDPPSPSAAATSAAPVSRSPEANAKLTAAPFETPSAKSTPAVVPMPATAPPAVIGRIAVAALMQRTTSASVGENRTPRALSKQGAAEGARRPAAQEQQTRDDRRPREPCAIRDAPVDGVEAVRASDEREPCHSLSQRDDPEAADAKQDDDDQRRAEDRPRRCEGGEGQRKHRHCVDHAEGNDRDGNRPEPEPDAAQPAQSEDLHDVVEPEGQDDSARRGRPAGGETPCAVRALATGEELVPSKCAEAEAGEIGASGKEDQGDVCAFQGPARVAQVSSDEDTRGQREKRERESTEEPPAIRTVVDPAPANRGPTHADRGTNCDRFDQRTLAIGTVPSNEMDDRSSGAERRGSSSFAPVASATATRISTIRSSRVEASSPTETLRSARYCSNPLC